MNKDKEKGTGKDNKKLVEARAEVQGSGVSFFLPPPPKTITSKGSGAGYKFFNTYVVFNLAKLLVLVVLNVGYILQNACSKYLSIRH